MCPNKLLAYNKTNIEHIRTRQTDVIVEETICDLYST